MPGADAKTSQNEKASLSQQQVAAHPASTAPTVSFTYIDAYLIYHFGYKAGENVDQTICNILCYLKNQLVGYINFYQDASVPLSTIGVPGSDEATILMLNFPIGQLPNVIATLRLETSVVIRVDTIQRVAWVGGGVAPVGHVKG